MIVARRLFGFFWWSFVTFVNAFVLLNTYCPKDGCSCVSAFGWAVRILFWKVTFLLLVFLDQNFVVTNLVGVVISRLFRNSDERAVDWSWRILKIPCTRCMSIVNCVDNWCFSYVLITISLGDNHLSICDLLIKKSFIMSRKGWRMDTV